MSINVREDKMQHAELLGRPVLYTRDRISKFNLPSGWRCYELRGTSTDPDVPNTLEIEVDDHYAGAVLSPYSLKKPSVGFKKIQNKLILGEDQMDLAEFCQAHGLNYPAAGHQLKSVPVEEAGLCYTQLPGQDAEIGCIGYMLLDPGFELKFSSKWISQQTGPERKELWTEFQTVLDELRQYGPLRDPHTTVEFCEKHPEAEIPGDMRMRGFRLDAESITCYVRCSTIPRGSSYIYLYDKDKLRDFLERVGSDISDRIRVTGYGEMCELFPEYAHEVATLQTAIPGLVNYAATLAVRGEMEKIPELREYIIHMVEFCLTPAETNPNVTDIDWAEKKYGDMVDKAVTATQEAGEAPELSSTDIEALYAGLELYVQELIADGASEDWLELETILDCLIETI